MKLRRMTVLRLTVLPPLSLVMFAYGLASGDLQFMNFGIILLWVNNVLFAIERLAERLFYLAFMITFFTFILGRTVASLIYDFENYHFFPDEILVHTNICIYVALVSLWLGYYVVERLFLNKNSKNKRSMADNEDRYDTPEYQSIRLVSKQLFFATFTFAMLIAIEKGRFVYLQGYAQYYVSYASSYPYIIVKLADVCKVAFYIFLATMPNRREVRIPTALYLLLAFVSVFGGKRSSLVVPLITVFIYYAVRNRIHNCGEQWLTKQHVITVCLIMPFLLAMLYSFNFVRFGGVSSARSLPEMVAGFFDNLGFSVNIISYEKLFEASLPHKIYSFGDTYDYLRENVLTQLFFDFPVYKNQTVDKALYGHNFTQTITYLYSERYYLAGRGLGSCYIAEAYHDFGYLGIILWSFVYCFVLANVYSFKNRGIVYNTLAFTSLKFILEAPRNMASAFISEYINVNTWLVIIVVFFAAKVLQRATISQYKDARCDLLANHEGGL